jgi:hypothetical protein
MYQHNLPWRNWPLILIAAIIVAVLTLFHC